MALTVFLRLTGNGLKLSFLIEGTLLRLIIIGLDGFQLEKVVCVLTATLFISCRCNME